MDFVVTEELVRRIERSRAGQYRERMESVARIRGNPWGVEVRRFGDVTAVHSADMNTVFGLEDDQLEHLDEIVAWYDGFGREPAFDTLPLESSSRVGPALVAHGFQVFAQHSILCGRAVATDGSPAFPSRRLPKADREFAEVWRVCYGDKPKDSTWPEWRARAMATYDGKRFQRFVIDGDDGPAALGISHHADDGIAYLTNAGTAEPYRRRGMHGELLRVRIDCAARAGYEIVAGDAEPYSDSHRNMERAGLRLGFQKLRWERPDRD